MTILSNNIISHIEEHLLHKDLGVEGVVCDTIVHDHSESLGPRHECLQLSRKNKQPHYDHEFLLCKHLYDPRYRFIEGFKHLLVEENECPNRILHICYHLKY